MMVVVVVERKEYPISSRTVSLVAQYAQQIDTLYGQAGVENPTKS
jgi:hypothetical protein